LKEEEFKNLQHCKFSALREDGSPYEEVIPDRDFIDIGPADLNEEADDSKRYLFKLAA